MNTAMVCLHAWILPMLVLGGMPCRAINPESSLILKITPVAQVADVGPQGLYVDIKGFDDNDDVVGNVMYNNQDPTLIHIAAIYVHGENIATQGRFELNMDVKAGEKKQLLVIMRDKKGMRSTVHVDLHYQ